MGVYSAGELGLGSGCKSISYKARMLILKPMGPFASRRFDFN